ncbi:hypothetical protein NC651_029036 [Populus alba x Populus x berolinensis]|nr:hypothetical protein NC651_029036 [Populus alba x Populus x berolinensis]
MFLPYSIILLGILMTCRRCILVQEGHKLAPIQPQLGASWSHGSSLCSNGLLDKACAMIESMSMELNVIKQRAFSVLVEHTKTKNWVKLKLPFQIYGVRS